MGQIDFSFFFVVVGMRQLWGIFRFEGSRKQIELVFRLINLVFWDGVE